jgi:hypothetical protein
MLMYRYGSCGPCGGCAFRWYWIGDYQEGRDIKRLQHKFDKEHYTFLSIFFKLQYLSIV